MVGIPGSGKSTFAERFAETFQALIISQTKLQQEYDLPLTSAESLRDFVLTQYMKTKRTILVDGGINSKLAREELTKQLKKAGYQTLVVWVQTDTSEALRRASKPYPRGSGLSTESFDLLVDQFDPPHEKEKTIVISGKHTYASQLKIVLRQLASEPAKAAARPITPTAPVATSPAAPQVAPTTVPPASPAAPPASPPHATTPPTQSSPTPAQIAERARSQARRLFIR